MVKKSFHFLLHIGLLIALGLNLFGCNKPDLKEEAAAFKPGASLQEIMLSIIDPNADHVWNSVSIIITDKGLEEHSPKTEEEWAEVRQHAITLAEAANLLLIPGRRVAHEGAETSTHPVELGAEHIEQAIAKDRTAFIASAHLLHTAVYEAVIAIDKKDPEDLMRAGEHIQQACEACHAKFWYPDEKTPTFPSLSGSSY